MVLKEGGNVASGFMTPRISLWATQMALGQSEKMTTPSQW